MARLALRLFGTPRIELDHQPLPIRRRKGVALLAYLAVTQHAHHRDALATLLFPEYDQTGARENFRRILSSLYSELNHTWLQIDRAIVALPPTEELWVDVNHFRSLRVSTRSHGHAVDQTCAPCMAALGIAAALYADDFLRGFTLPDSPDFDDWQRGQCERLRTALDDVLERLGWGHAAQGARQTALDYARRRLALDPLHEAAHRQAIHLYAEAGQPTAALRPYAECVRMLETELGLAPAHPATGADGGDRLWAQLEQDHRVQRREPWGRGPDQNRIFEECTQVLGTLAAAHPLLLMLDDLHWADASSISLLFYLGRHLAGHHTCAILLI